MQICIFPPLVYLAYLFKFKPEISPSMEKSKSFPFFFFYTFPQYSGYDVCPAITRVIFFLILSGTTSFSLKIEIDQFDMMNTENAII